MNKTLRSGAVIMAGVVAAVTFAAAPAQAGGSACAASSSPPSSAHAGTVCVTVYGPGVQVNTSDTTFRRTHGGLAVCDRRAWNMGYITRTDAFSVSSAVYYGCVSGQSTIRMGIYRKVYSPSYYSAQFQANGGWVPAIPRFIATS